MTKDDPPAEVEALNRRLEEARATDDPALAKQIAEDVTRVVLEGMRSLQRRIIEDAERETRIGVKAPPVPGQPSLRRLATPEERDAAELERCGALANARCVYLDWNVMVQFQRGQLGRLREFLHHRQAQKLRVPFSAEHVREASRVESAPYEKQGSFLAENLALLSTLSDDWYLYHAADTRGHAEFRNQRPQEVLQTLKEAQWPLKAEAEDVFLRFLTPELVSRMRQAWALDPADLSTIVPEDVVEYIDRQIAANVAAEGAPRTLRALLEMGHRMHPDHETFDLTNRLAGCFKVLDLLGYRPESKNRERAAFLDSSHAGMASFTDCLITADQRFRDKARVAYRIYSVPTAVLDAVACDRAAAP